MAHERHQVLGRMNFESPYVDMPHRLTVRQNLRVFARLYGVTDIERKIARLADDLALVEFLDRASGEFFGGTENARGPRQGADQRSPIAAARRADSLARSRHGGLGARLSRGASPRPQLHWIMLASHNMAEVERLCDRVIMLKRGSLIDDASPADLLARYGRSNLEDVFHEGTRGRCERQKSSRLMSNPAAVSLGRIGAMVLRYTYLLRSSWPRLLEMIYWPAVQMLTWGFFANLYRPGARRRVE